MNTAHQIHSFKKTDVVIINDTQRIVIAKLQAEGNNPVTYSVCNAHDLKGSLHGISLEDALLVPPEVLTEEIRLRASYFA